MKTKHTQGECTIKDTVIYANGRKVCGMFYDLNPGDSAQKRIIENKAYMELICEAFNVANETGKTPRQLADENKELLEACKTLMTSIDSGMDVIKSLDKATIAIHNATK